MKNCLGAERYIFQKYELSRNEAGRRGVYSRRVGRREVIHKDAKRKAAGNGDSYRSGKQQKAKGLAVAAAL